MSEERISLLRLFSVSILWGINFVISSYLLQNFSPIFLSFARLVITSVFLLLVALRWRNLRLPTKKEWGLLAGVGIFGTLLNQTFFFTGLKYSTAANAALIIALAPLATVLLARMFLREQLTVFKITGAFMGLAGVSIIVLFGDGGFTISTGDIYLLFAMLTLSISLLFVRSLTASMPSYAVTIFATVLGSFLMIPAAAFEAFRGQTVMGHSLFVWLLLIAAAVVTQGLAGFWWNQGVARVGASTASMFMNIPPFIALIVAHFVLGDPILVSQLIGGVLILLGVAVSNQKSLTLPRHEKGV